MIVGVDFDGTLADTNSVKSDWIRNNLKLYIPPYHCDRTSCIPFIGEDNYKRMGRYVFSREVTLSLHPFPNCLKVIKDLSYSVKFIIITARIDKRICDAIEWLFQYEETREIPILGCSTNLISKVEKCRINDIDILIDDDERHLNGAKDLGIKAILFKHNAPYNIIYKKGIICRSWKGIKEEITREFNNLLI